MAERIVEFVRKKDLILVEELGQGACGRTVVLYDDVIDERFVCKKYSPIDEDMKEELFDNFVREIKLLHLLNHVNVVRVFNYYIYPDQFAGYIIMEFVKGTDIEEYLTGYPENINESFIQVIDAFTHLEKNKILHRDIRPQNILVTESGLLKIIDFGFGKQIFTPKDFGKSITLNWWCEPPSEFADEVYDYTTEVYFVGKLFQKIIIEKAIEQFKYTQLLGRMCASRPSERISSFSQVRKELLTDKFLDIDFNDSELAAYREFSNSLAGVISKIEEGTKYWDDAEEIQRKLESCYKKVMLEEVVPYTPLLVTCFVNGSYYFATHDKVSVSVVKAFVDLFRSCSREKKNIVLSNIHTRLDSIKRYDVKIDFDEDIPF